MITRDMFLPEPSEKLQLIADSVLRLSNFYIENPEAETPWNESFCQIAYLNYYLPLNFQRCQLVIKRGLQVGFFADLNLFVDWGCGPATASLALADNEILKTQIKEQILFDISPKVLNAFSNLHSKIIKAQSLTRIDLSRFKKTEANCLVFSYSLTEVEKLPYGWNQFEALMILEPSTSQDGRHLFELRKELIENDYFIWAPCTHQLSCPLLTHSKHDWCHDRTHVVAPEWFYELEQLLPMKNKTVTTSYLLARKRSPPENLKNKMRLTGDSLEENGKTRQLVCKGDAREYLSWMHKSITPQVIPRGELLDLPLDFEIKSNEIRLKSPLNIN